MTLRKRVEHLNERLGRTLGDSCHARLRLPDVRTHSRRDYPKRLRRDLGDRVGSAPTVRHVGPRAEAMGLKVGDTLLSLRGQPVRADSRDMQAAMALGRVRFRRAAGPIAERRYDSPLQCGPFVRLLPDGAMIARTYAQGVEISVGMIKAMESEDELAFSLAHEIVHHALGHSAMTDDSSIEHRHALEAQADRGAVYLLRSIGLDGMAGSRFYDRLSDQRPLGFLGRSTHPPAQARHQAIAEASADYDVCDTRPDVCQSLRSFVDHGGVADP